MNKKLLVFLLISILIIGVGFSKEDSYELNKKVLKDKDTIEISSSKDIDKNNQQLKIESLPATEYKFIEWTNGLSGEDRKERIIMVRDVTIETMFNETTNY